MARLKKGINNQIKKAQKRLDGMKAIDPALDLGEGVTVAAFEAVINAPINLISQYNILLSQADDLLNQINAATDVMNDFSERVLSGGKFKFGADSSEYEMLGGTRKSERKKPGKKNGGEGSESERLSTR